MRACLHLQGKEWQKALALLVRMQHDNIQPNLKCMNSAINALAQVGEWKRAEGIMQMITDAGLQPNVYSYNSLAHAYVTVTRFFVVMFHHYLCFLFLLWSWICRRSLKNK